MNLSVYDLQGNSLGEMKADPELFEVKKNEEAVHSTLRWLLNSKRAGTHSTLTRAEVSGGGKKPWKQKGTGRARAGSIRSPLWRHGGVIFGPKPRDYSFHLPKKVRHLALKVVLSDRARDGRVKIVESFDVEKPKTKVMCGILKSMNLTGQKTIIIVDKPSKNLVLASQNIQKLKVVTDYNVNIFDLLDAENVVVAKPSISNLKELLV